MIIIHLIITAGLALVASGASSFGAKDGKDMKDEIFVKTGVVILVTAWLLIAAGTLVSFLPSQYNRHAPAFIDGSKVGPPSQTQHYMSAMLRFSAAIRCTILPAVRLYSLDLQRGVNILACQRSQSS